MKKEIIGTIRYVLEDDYGITPRRITGMDLGSVNLTYLIESPNDKFVLRVYRRNTSKNQIEPEHKLIAFLRAKNFPTAGVLRAKTGNTVIKKKFGLLALFQFIPGNHIQYPNLAQIKAVAHALGNFHFLVRDFNAGFKRRWWYLKSIPLEHYYRRAVILDRSNPLLPFLREQIMNFRKNMPKSVIESLPQLIVHDDFSLENIKFIGNKISGVFDFDNAHREVRIFDLVRPIESVLWLEKFRINERWLRIFIKEYETKARSQLAALERHCLFEIFRIRHLQEALWQIRQYLRYKRLINQKALRQQITKLRWLNRHENDLNKLFQSL